MSCEGGWGVTRPPRAAAFDGDVSPPLSPAQLSDWHSGAASFLHLAPQTQPRCLLCQSPTKCVLFCFCFFASIKIFASQNRHQKTLSRRVKPAPHWAPLQRRGCLCVCMFACTCLFTRSLRLWLCARLGLCPCVQRGGSACVCLKQARSAMWDNLAGNPALPPNTPPPPTPPALAFPKPAHPLSPPGPPTS